MSRLCLCAGLALLLCSPARLAAFDPFHQQVVPKNAAVVAQFDRPARLLKLPLFTEAWKIAQQSSEVRALLKSPALESVRQVLSHFERHLKTDWQGGFEKLTAGGVTLVRPEFTRESYLLVVTADSKETMSRFVAGAQELVRAEATRRGAKGDPIVARDYRGLTGYKVGPVIYTVSGARLLASSDPQLLKKMVDQLLDSPKVSSSPGKHPLARLTVNFAAAKKILPKEVRELLTLPSDHNDAAGTWAFFGAFLDLFKRSDKLTFDIDVKNGGLEIQAHVPAKRSGTPKELIGLHATQESEAAPPLLKLPGRIAALSTYVEWATPWKNRGKFLSPKRKADLEAADRELKQQFSVIGLRDLPSAVITQMGPHWRFAAARQGEITYRVKPPAKFPAFVAAISLRDQKEFTRIMSPLLRTFRIILTAENQGKALNEDYRGADLQIIGFKDDPKARAKINAFTYNFSPTFTITRGHFIIGSTTKIVKDTIDALEKEKTEPPAKTKLNEHSHISFPGVADALADFEDLFVQQLVLGSGVKFTEARKEIATLKKAIETLGELRQQSIYDETGYRYIIRWTPTQK